MAHDQSRACSSASKLWAASGSQIGVGIDHTQSRILRFWCLVAELSGSCLPRATQNELTPIECVQYLHLVNDSLVIQPHRRQLAERFD